MSDEGISDEMLMAFVDGELDAGAAASIQAAIAGNPALAERVRRFSVSREVVKAAFAPVRQEAPPARLVAAALAGDAEGKVAALRRSRFVSLREALPLAASLMLAAGLAGLAAGYFAAGGSGAGPEVETPSAALLGDRDFGLLASAAAGSEVDRPGAPGTALKVVSSFRTNVGYCRLAEARIGDGAPVRGVGCRTPEGWRTLLTVTLAEDTRFSPAATAGVEALDTFLDTLEATHQLEPAEEAATIAKGWRD